MDTEFDPSDVRVTCTVNGELRQDGRTRDFLFVRHPRARRRPDDRTPPGVRPVAVGDTMTVEVEGLGSLTNPVVAAR
jgi:2-keto-4-pentenoate hydratase/2-oxohepta-3-ene-1,7-dioic acid hydratase in catechol pathway